jgi:redox-sensitive bicupin YhaK (pirin superfamily)
VSTRSVNGIYRGAGFHWVGDGFRVTNYFPSSNDFGRKISPFILLDYHPPFAYPPSENRRRGVGSHPHRGFETVTIAFAGSVAHHDSGGNSGVIGPGDVQWMTAGSGVLHKEYHEEAFARAGGDLHMAQLWVNLPRSHKMTAPRYQSITDSQVGVAKLPDDAGVVRVIAGEYNGVRGPAMTFSPVSLFDVRLAPQGRVPLSFPAQENASILVISGSVRINGKTDASALDFVLFENDGNEIVIEAQTAAQFLVLHGTPIDEPVVQYGPFVMNTEAEIRQAFADFKSGAFGHLED